ncbi:MAG: hypothetical protein ACI9SY_000733 [Candidatus Paceibacteria bacterium]|jgi:hypothetical protein
MQHHVTLIRSANPLSYIPETEHQTTFFTYDKVGIDEIRLITAQASLRPSEGNEYVFVLNSLFLTHEAQNALLKLFEEPPTGLSFHLVLPESVGLLPTLMSRVGQEIHQASSTDDAAWDAFSSASPAERLKQIDGWQKAKDQVWLQTIVRGVHNVKSSELSVTALPVLRLVGEKLATRGASNKMLLEHLALVLPLRK